MFIVIALTLMFICILTIVFLLREREIEEENVQFYSLGTINTIKVYGKKAKAAIEEAKKKVMEIDDKMSVFKEESEITKINDKAGLSLVKVSMETFYLIKKAIYYCNLFDGYFDITIRPIVKLWGIGHQEERVPTEIEIEEKLKLVNYEDIILDENSCSIGLKNSNQEIDVGGIAKGYAADLVKEILKKNKIKNGIINLGGNVYVLGRKSDGKDWCVGIQDPLNENGKFLGTISTRNKSIVTSGNYERYFFKDGKSYHHIIDTKTGYPSEGEIISATIVSDFSIDGDGLSTGVFIYGVEKAINLIEGLYGIEAILITKSKEVFLTSNLKNIFTLTNNDYCLREATAI